MPKLSREVAIRRLKELDMQTARDRFEMGDIALDQCPMGERGHDNGSHDDLERLAEEAGVSYDSLYQYRFVSHKTPNVTRVTSVSWSVYREVALREMPDADRTSLLHKLAAEEAGTISGRWTVNAVRPLIGRKPVVHTRSEPVVERVREAPTDLKADILEELEADPAVNRVMLERGEAKRVERDRTHREVLKTDSIARKIDAMTARNTLEGLLDRFVRDAAEVLPRIDPSDFSRDTEPGIAAAYFLRSRIAAVRGVVDQIEGWLNTGKVGGDIDAFFAQVLAEKKEGGTT